MKHAITVTIAALAIYVPLGQAVASEAPTSSQLSGANTAAIAAIRTYESQPNGTTHALADLAFCELRERLDGAYTDEASRNASQKQVAALVRLRAYAKLPAVDCAARDTAAVFGQPRELTRPVSVEH